MADGARRTVDVGRARYLRLTVPIQRTREPTTGVAALATDATTLAAYTTYSAGRAALASGPLACRTLTPSS